MTVQKLL